MYRHNSKLSRAFYEKDTLTVARQLLGKRLVNEAGDGTTVGEIVESEAYIGPEDRASHAYGGRRTPRVEVQYGPAGHAYIYSIHAGYCFDITTGPLGKPEAVLTRALRPVYGAAVMAKRRGIKPRNPPDEKQLAALCNGPLKLSEAMGIGKEHKGIDLCGDVLYLEAGRRVKPEEPTATTRIGIDYAGAARKFPWRFCIANCTYVSRPVFASPRQ